MVVVVSQLLLRKRKVESLPSRFTEQLMVLVAAGSREDWYTTAGEKRLNANNSLTC